MGMKGRTQVQNIMKVKPGPTSYSAVRVQAGSPLSAFRIFFDESMLRYIQKCTNIEGQRAINSSDWNVTLDELEKFIGLIIVRGIINGRNQELKDFWSIDWGCPLFNMTMSRARFTEILKYLRFDIKNERKHLLKTDKFALISTTWNAFIENCKKAYVSFPYVTIDEQLLPCKARCKFIQYMANKPDKFGIKFFLAVDVQNKYMFNAVPYLGKDEGRKSDISLPTHVVMTLMEPLFGKGYNVTCNNYFTSVNLMKNLCSKNAVC